MIIQTIGYVALVFFIINFCFAEFVHRNYEDVRGFVIIDNTLLLICAAICLK